MKKLGLAVFVIGNILISTYYIIDIVKYFSGTYNYDGMRYLIPIAVADVVFLISLIILSVSFKFSYQILVFIGLIFFHNFAMVTGIERIPFVGILAVITSLFYSYKIGVKL